MRKCGIPSLLVWVLLDISPTVNCQLWRNYDDTAKQLSQNGQFQQSLDYFLKSNRLLAGDSANTHSFALNCYALGNNYSKLRRWKEAEPFYVKALDIWESMKDESYNYGRDGFYYILGCVDLANAQMKLEKYDKAEALFLHAKKKYVDYSITDENYVAVCINLGFLYKRMGQYDKAKPIYNEAQQLLINLNRTKGAEYATVINNLADLFMDLGEYEKAEEYYHESKLIREKIPREVRNYTQSWNNLGDLYITLGQYEKAELCFLQAGTIIDSVFGAENFDYAQHCNNLGMLYKELHQYDKAMPLLVQAKQIAERLDGKDTPEYSAYCSNLGNLYGDLGRYKEAELLLVEVRTKREKTIGKNHVAYALSCDNLGGLYVIMEQLQKAEKLLLEANRLYKTLVGEEHLYFSRSCKNLVVLYWRTKKIDLAKTYLNRANQSEEMQVRKIFQFTAEHEKIQFVQNILDGSDIDHSFYFSQFPHSKGGESFDLSVRNRSLILKSSVQMRQAIHSSSDTALQRLYKRWINEREELSSQYSKPVWQRSPDISKREAAVVSLEKQLSRASTSFSTLSQSKPGWRSIQQKLRPNEAAIEFVEFEFSNNMRGTDSVYYIALLLKKSIPEPLLIPLFEKKQLDSVFAEREDLPTEMRINSTYRANQRLYNLAWKPLEKHLKGITKIFYAPDGNLFKMAFAALPIDDKHVLGDKYQLQQLASTAIVVTIGPVYVQASDSIRLFGGIDYSADRQVLVETGLAYRQQEINNRSLPSDPSRGTGFRFLPGSRDEVRSIKKQADSSNYNASVLLGVEATEESIKAINKNSPAVLHIATHGFFFPDPKATKQDDISAMFDVGGRTFKQSANPLLRSGLAFAGANNAWKGQPIDGIEDGILTAYEVSNMYLPNTKLVVLSACETGLGDVQGNEGIYGLQRAFGMSGASNLVMSLWKVPDHETAEFMQIFYEYIFAKKDVADAFYAAQKEMKNRYSTSPYKWAAWILVQ